MERCEESNEASSTGFKFYKTFKVLMFASSAKP